MLHCACLFTHRVLQLRVLRIAITTDHTTFIEDLSTAPCVAQLDTLQLECRGNTLTRAITWWREHKDE